MDAVRNHGYPQTPRSVVSVVAAPLPRVSVPQADDQVGLGCILDTETTGLSGRDEAIELALVLFAYRRADSTVLGVVDEYTGLREPTVPISPGAQEVHGISAAELKGKRLDHMRVEAILHTAEFIVAHNASFDRRFVLPLSDTAGEKPWLCTMRGIDWPGFGYPSKALQDLLSAHRIPSVQAHRALDDVYGVLRLLSCQTPNGTYLAELLRGLDR